MSNVKNIIITEKRLKEMFDLLPNSEAIDGSASFKPIFGYGDKKELNAFLKAKNLVKTRTPYPLIWLLYPYNEYHCKTDVEIERLSLILAVQTNASMGNEKRINSTFSKILFPLLNNIKWLFTRAIIVNWDNKFELTKYPNYSEDDSATEHAGTFIWDALKFVIDIKITDDCLNDVRF